MISSREDARANDRDPELDIRDNLLQRVGPRRVIRDNLVERDDPLNEKVGERDLAKVRLPSPTSSSRSFRIA